MKLTKILTATALTVAITGGMFAAPAYADVPKGPAAISVLDTNKNGRIEKDEYISYMSAAFDKSAGTKGYCTFEEIASGFQALNKMIEP
jgi:hypothetical protein